MGGPVSDELFLGNALNGVDAKNRVSIPAAFRDVLGARGDGRTVIVAPAERADCLVGYDQGYPARARAELAMRFVGNYSDARDDHFRGVYGTVEKMPVDDNGRIILSTTMKDCGEIDRVALFWGIGETFEIWNPQRFIERPNLDPRAIRMVRRLLDARGAG